MYSLSNGVDLHHWMLTQSLSGGGSTVAVAKAFSFFLLGMYK